MTDTDSAIEDIDRLQLDLHKRTLVMAIANGAMGGAQAVGLKILQNIDRDKWNTISYVSFIDGDMCPKFAAASDYFFSLTGKRFGGNLKDRDPVKARVISHLLRTTHIDVLHIINCYPTLKQARDLDNNTRLVVSLYGDYRFDHAFYTDRLRQLDVLHGMGKNLHLISDSVCNYNLFPPSLLTIIDTAVWDTHKGIRPKRDPKGCVWVGRNGGEKRPSALYDLAEYMSDFNFTMVSNGPVPHRKMPKNLTLVQTQDARELERIYKSHTFYLNTSQTEGVPLTLIESMKCGCIPVVPALGGMPEKVAGIGSTISLIKLRTFCARDKLAYKRAILHYYGMSDKDKLALRKAAVERMSTHTLDRMMQDTISVYEG